MREKLCIIGAGGHARSVISLLKDQGYDISGIYDDTYKEGKPELINSIKLRGCIADYNGSNSIILSIGDNAKRKVLYERFFDKVYQQNIYHSTTFIDDSVGIGLSNLIFGNVFINANVEIANNNIINTGSIIEHEVMIGSHNHISLGAIVCGRAMIGNNCFLGAGSVTNDSVSICDNVIIGSNSTVISSINEPGIYVGQPVRKINFG